MKERLSKTLTFEVLLGIIVILLGVLGYGGYRYWQLEQSLQDLHAKYDEATSTLEAKALENQSLQSTLAVEQNKNSDFENQLTGLSNAVTSIHKLQETDPQLLAKYSKVYFLNDNYVPKELVNIATSSAYPDKKEYLVLPLVNEHLEQMIAAADEDGVHLQVISAYRSFKSQASLKYSYKFTYGSGANAFSADQGYSEHQLGTTVDFTTKELGAAFNQFEKTKGYEWLTKNAYRYGFILSYPSGNSYYVFEPWHWRYVGHTLAEDLHDQNKYFYQLDQRTINEYLLNFANGQ